jgi:hypothetical protein
MKKFKRSKRINNKHRNRRNTFIKRIIRSLYIFYEVKCIQIYASHVFVYFFQKINKPCEKLKIEKTKKNDRRIKKLKKINKIVEIEY